jgi:D-alanyl-D-alanine dipeptidase
MTVDIRRPVPIRDKMFTTLDYHAVPFDFADPRAGEKLVDLATLGIAGDNYYARTDGSNPPYLRRIAGAIDGLWARASVAERLVRANRALAELNFELYVFDAYRPIACQAGIWEFFVQAFRAARPDAPESEIERQTLPFVSDPRWFNIADPTTWPLHSTGGAVDLTLRDRTTRQLRDMGSGFDQTGAVSRTDHFERALQAGEIAADDPRLLHRRALFHAMTQAGFSNYGQEYWHYDHGDQMDAVSRAEADPATLARAWYGYVAPPDASPGQ